MMKKLIKTYHVANDGTHGLSYTYSLFLKHMLIFPQGYYMEITSNETGEMRSFGFDLDTSQEDHDKLFSKISFKGFVRVQEEKHAEQILQLLTLPGASHYFSWDTHIFENESAFNPTDESYCFWVNGWHLNHTAICQTFLTGLFGDKIEPYFPKDHNHTLLWIITDQKAILCPFDLKEHKRLEPEFSYPDPQHLFLLMASCNAFRHYYDKYLISSK